MTPGTSSGNLFADSATNPPHRATNCSRWMDASSWTDRRMGYLALEPDGRWLEEIGPMDTDD